MMQNPASRSYPSVDSPTCLMLCSKILLFLWLGDVLQKVIDNMSLCIRAYFPISFVVMFSSLPDIEGFLI